MIAPAGLAIRPACEADISFLVEAIVSAERSGTDILSYCTLFDLSEGEVRALLAEILREDVSGQELAVSGFLVGEVLGEPQAAMSSWVEAGEGRPSGLLKANLLLHFVGRERFAAAAPKMKLVETVALPRTPGALQLECVHVDAARRGQGLIGRLVLAHLERAAQMSTPPASAEIILMKTNASALRAYFKAGFEISGERTGDDPALAGLLPATTKVIMSRSLLQANRLCT